MGDCLHNSWEVLVFEPEEWQEDVVYTTIRNEHTGEERPGGMYLHGHNDICCCTDCALVATRRGTFTYPESLGRG